MPPVVTMNPFMVPSSPFVQTNATTTPQPSARFTAAAVIPTAHFHHQQQQQQQQGYFMEARVPMFIPAQQQQQPLNGVFMGQPQQGMFLVPRDGQQQQQHGGFVLAGHESGGCFVLAPPPYGGAVMMAMPTQQMPTMHPFFMQPSNNNAGSPFMEFSPNDTQFVHPAVMQVPEPMSSAPMRTPAHGRALGATCMWIPLTDEPRHVQRTGNPRHCEKLFIGQARHETTTAHIVLMLEALCGVIPAVLRPAGKGCFILFVSSMEDCHRVTTLHRRVLFDHNGVWFAANDAGLATLSAYVQSPSFHRACRRQLPVQCMVAEYQPDTIEPGWKSAAAAVNSGFDTPVPSSAQSTSTDTPQLADE